ncbi:MAG: hypothetical protein ACRDZT_07450, partial [Acidimicrobiales bacterium]
MASLFTLLEIKGPRDRIVKSLDRLEAVQRGSATGSAAAVGAAVPPSRAPARHRVHAVVARDKADGEALLEGLGSTDGAVAA